MKHSHHVLEKMGHSTLPLVHLVSRTDLHQRVERNNPRKKDDKKTGDEAAESEDQWRENKLTATFLPRKFIAQRNNDNFEIVAFQLVPFVRERHDLL